MTNSKNSNIAVLLNGTNEGKLIENLDFALEKIKNLGTIIKTSSHYGSEAWGFDSQDFVNQAILLSTQLPTIDLLDKLQQVEKEAGRKSKTTSHYEARVLDIDIIFYDDEIIETERLIIPHPHMQNRKFVLEPLNEIIPEYSHPTLFKTVQELLRICTDNGKVWKY
jgi:2-amino-4-hydroxy-6-hydroxymethyldihydropteridine diphosphokinase